MTLETPPLKSLSRATDLSHYCAPHQIVHRSLGRYDLSLEAHASPALAPLASTQSPGIQVARAVLAMPHWRQLLARLLGPDHRINFTVSADFDRPSGALWGDLIFNFNT